MTNIGKNIKQLRQAAGLSQEQLAEKLIVTRQAVSGWEVGRSQPDIEMLEALAAALDTDLNEIIYGKKLECEPYNKQKYKIAALVCGLSVVAFLVVASFFESDLEQAYYRFQDGNLYMWWLLVFKPLFGYLAISILVFSLISLRADIRLRKQAAQIFLVPGALLFLGLNK